MAESPQTRAAASASSADDGDKKTAPAPAPATSAAAEAPSDPEFHRDRLIAESDAFVGHPTWIVAGALASSKKKHFTVAETKAAVKSFLATEVS